MNTASICLRDTSFSSITFQIILTYDGPSFDILILSVREEEELVGQSCPMLWDPMYCSQPGSSVHGILQARILEWVATSFSRGPFQPRCQTWVSYVSCIAGGFFTIWVTRGVVLSTRCLSKLANFGVTLLLVSFVSWISYELAYSYSQVAFFLLFLISCWDTSLYHCPYMGP